MTLLALDIPPGMARFGTDYMSAGRWFDGNLVRFFRGARGPVGGWTPLLKTDATAVTVTGRPSALLAWRGNGMPARGVLTLTGNAANGNTVTIDGKTYTFQTVLTNVDGNVLIGADAATSIDNLIAAITLGAGSGTLYAAATVLHPTVTASAGAGDTMNVEAKSVGTIGNGYATTETLTNGSFGAATLTGGLGSKSTPWLAIGTDQKIYAYAEGVLADITATDTGAGTQSLYGAGLYGANLFGGSEQTATGGALQAEAGAVWSLDNFGAYLIGVLSSDGKLRRWTGDTALDMETVANAPTGNSAVVVTPERFVMLLGANGDPRNVAWCSQEDMDDWTPSALNTAGDFPLETSGLLLCGRRTPRETLIWTDTDLWTAIYVGGTLVYAFEKRGSACGAIGPHATAVVGDGAIWMSEAGFFIYDGAVRPLGCEVFDYVFGRLNYSQRRRIVAVSNAKYGEVWFYYPSTGNDNPDSYVVYNWLENHWTLGALPRTAALDAGIFETPIKTTSDGQVFKHETGTSYDSLTPYVESGPVELGDGDRVYMLRELIPDEKTAGQVNLTLYGRMYPNGSETTHGPYSMASPTSIRVTARQLRFRLTQEEAGWRVGRFRFDAALGGRR